MIMMHSNDVMSYETSCSFSITPSSGGHGVGYGTHRYDKVFFSALLVAGDKLTEIESTEKFSCEAHTKLRLLAL